MSTFPNALANQNPSPLNPTKWALQCKLVPISYGGSSKIKREQISKIFSRMREASKSNSVQNQKAYLAQALDLGMDYLASQPQDSNERSVKEVREICQQALAHLRQNNQPNGGDARNARQLAPAYRPEAMSFGNSPSGQNGFFVAHSYSDHTFLKGAVKAVNSPDPIGGLNRSGVMVNKGMVTKMQSAQLPVGSTVGLIPTDPTLMARSFATQMVVYMRRELRKKFEVRFSEEKCTASIPVLSDPSKDAPLDTGNKKFMYAVRFNKEGRPEFCAIDPALDVREEGLVNFVGDDLNVQHSSFFKGKSVVCAGMLTAKNGVITGIDNCSGHYQPNWKDLQQTVKIIKDQQKELSKQMTATALIPCKSSQSGSVLVEFNATQFAEKGVDATPLRFSDNDGGSWTTIKDSEDYFGMRSTYGLNVNLEDVGKMVFGTAPRSAKKPSNANVNPNPNVNPSGWKSATPVVWQNNGSNSNGGGETGHKVTDDYSME